MEALSRRPHGTSPPGRRPACRAPRVVRAAEDARRAGLCYAISRETRLSRSPTRCWGSRRAIRFVDHLIDVAAPHMSRFTPSYGWPLYLGTISDRAITIRHSTAAESPMSFERVGAAEAAARSCRVRSDRAWLAFCSADGTPRRACDDLGVTAGRASFGRRLRTHPAGRLRLHDPAALGRLQASASPSARASGSWAASSMRFIRSAMTEQEAGRRYGAPSTLSLRPLPPTPIARHNRDREKQPTNRRTPMKPQDVMQHPVNVLTEAQRESFFATASWSCPTTCRRHGGRVCATPRRS